MRRIKFRWVILPVALLAIGAIWIWWSRRLHVERIAIDGHTIEFARHGSGTPAMIFFTGGYGSGDSKIASWEPWLSGVKTTTFAYDRPGSGKSERAADHRTPVQIADELHALLARVGISPPYILVGRSLGGLYSRVFALRHPDDVAGLVLVDGSHERQWLNMNRFDPEKFPLLPPSDPNWIKPDFVGMAETWRTGRLDIEGKLPDVPLAVLTSLRHGNEKNPIPFELEEDWRKLQEEIFQSTTHGMHVVTAQSGHDIAHDEPELVWNAIRWVLDAARERIKHPPPPKK